MSASLLLPWCLLAIVMLIGLLIGRRYEKALQAQQAMARELLNAEQTLQRISQAVESASDAIGIGDMDANSLYHNRAHVGLFGYTVAELNAVTEPATLFADKDTAREIHETIRAGRSWAGETEIKTKDGRRIPAFVRADIIRDVSGHPVGIFGVFTDITERRRIEQSLDTERQRLAITLQSIADGVITVDGRGRVERLNRVAEQLTGWTQNEAESQPLARVFSILEETTRKPRVPVAAEHVDHRAVQPGMDSLLVTRDGRERLIAEKATLLSGAGGGMVVVFRDITEDRRRAEEKERANKLESLGLLAGGIAHDFNNILTVITGHLSLTEVIPDVPPAVDERLRSIEQATWRARGLTQQLLTFAKGGEPSKKTIELPHIIRESVGFATADAPEVVVELAEAADLWPVEADASQLGQVINNIALNAVQAMNRRGSLRIVSRNLVLSDVKGMMNPGARVVHLSLSDTGSGISPENLRKIFDPFYTTKANGTGLGLATVYSIISKHGGKMEVESVVGRGTTFHIYLKASSAEISREASQVPFPRPGQKSAGRVLVMDDENEIREIMSGMLETLGFEPTPAREGWKAIELFVQARDEGRPFDFVVLDLRVTSGLGGAETIKRLKEIDHRVKALVVSGYAEDPAMVNFRLAGFECAIVKPFGLEGLRRAIKPLVA
ncbi:MAG: sensor hybrid histidine kinase [Verrucomicrobia bacterium]|nr:sensor hybrid histidine kinase [Verrucomicrobiota bacterium]